MVIYTPIYLNQTLGFTWDKIGLIFTIMLTPFVLLTYPLGELSDKIGEKKMLLIGYVIASISTLSIPFIKSTDFWVWALVLFTTRVGAATIEIMTESYFFKRESEKDADAISFFRNTNPLSFVIGPLIALPIIYFLPSFSYLFYILGAILMGGILITIRLKDIK
jgi:MFS family permease